MTKRELFDRIEDYLSGRLSREGLKAFEAALEKDEALRLEVQVQRDMAKAIASDSKDNLREKLAGLRDRFPEDNPSFLSKIGKWFWIAGALLLVSGLGWFLMTDRPSKIPASEDANPAFEGPPPKEGGQSIIKEPSVDKSKKEQTTSPTRKESEQPNPPIAAHFEPNPLIEQEIQDLLRGDYQFLITQPETDARLAIRNGEADFTLSGSLETSEIPEEDFSLLVQLYSNKPTDFQSEKPILNQALALNPEGDLFLFEGKARLSIQPGLYYYLIKDDFSGAIFLAGRIYYE